MQKSGFLWRTKCEDYNILYICQIQVFTEQSNALILFCILRPAGSLWPVLLDSMNSFYMTYVTQHSE